MLEPRIEVYGSAGVTADDTASYLSSHFRHQVVSQSLHSRKFKGEGSGSRDLCFSSSSLSFWSIVLWPDVVMFVILLFCISKIHRRWYFAAEQLGRWFSTFSCSRHKLQSFHGTLQVDERITFLLRLHQFLNTAVLLYRTCYCKAEIWQTLDTDINLRSFSKFNIYVSKTVLHNNVC